MKKEKALQNYLEKYIGNHIEDIICIGKEFPVSSKFTLGNDDSIKNGYIQGIKRIDLLLLNKKTKKIIIAELKVSAGGADNSVMQLVDYYHFLMTDNSENKRYICKKYGLTDESFKDPELWIIARSYISNLLKNRIGYLSGDIREKIKIYHAYFINENPEDMNLAIEYPESSRSRSFWEGDVQDIVNQQLEAAKKRKSST